MKTDNPLPRVLFIDRDGTLIIEPPTDYQVDSLEKLELVPGALCAMRFIAGHLPYKLVMVTNQEGLGTDAPSATRVWNSTKYSSTARFPKTTRLHANRAQGC